MSRRSRYGWEVCLGNPPPASSTRRTPSGRFSTRPAYPGGKGRPLRAPHQTGGYAAAVGGGEGGGGGGRLWREEGRALWREERDRGAPRLRLHQRPSPEVEDWREGPGDGGGCFARRPVAGQRHCEGEWGPSPRAVHRARTIP